MESVWELLPDIFTVTQKERPLELIFEDRNSFALIGE